MLNPTPIERDEPNPFDALETVAEILGFVWHDEGEAGLRQALDMFKNPEERRESWLCAANQLCEAGMFPAADIVYEFGKQFPSGKPKNPHPKGSKLWAMVEGKWRRWHTYPALEAYLAKLPKKRPKH
jgi:hypothetical protein